MRVLWNWVFAPIGFLLVIISLAVAGLTVLRVVETEIFLDEETFELWIDKNAPELPITSEFRIPSPTGQRELVVAKRGSSAIMAVRAPGEALQSDRFIGAFSLWDGDPQNLPVQIIWQSENLIRFVYCDPSPTWVTLKPDSTVGTVEAEFVRAPNCRQDERPATEPLPADENP